MSGIAAEEIISVLPAGEQPSTSHCGRKSGVRTKGNPSVHLHTNTSPQTPHLHAAAHGHKPIVSSSLNTSPTPMCPSVSPTQHTLVPHCVSAPRLTPTRTPTHPHTSPTLRCEYPTPFHVPPTPACLHTPQDSPMNPPAPPGLTPQLPGAGLDAVGEPGLAALKHGGGEGLSSARRREGEEKAAAGNAEGWWGRGGDGAEGPKDGSAAFLPGMFRPEPAFRYFNLR